MSPPAAVLLLTAAAVLLAVMLRFWRRAWQRQHPHDTSRCPCDGCLRRRHEAAAARRRAEADGFMAIADAVREVTPAPHTRRAPCGCVITAAPTRIVAPCRSHQAAPCGCTCYQVGPDGTVWPTRRRPCSREHDDGYWASLEVREGLR